MCNYIQREYACNHFRWIAAEWCDDYGRTHKRCQPIVTHFEFRDDTKCGECKPKTYPQWEPMINRSMPKSALDRLLMYMERCESEAKSRHSTAGVTTPTTTTTTTTTTTGQSVGVRRTRIDSRRTSVGLQ